MTEGLADAMVTLERNITQHKKTNACTNVCYFEVDVSNSTCVYKYKCFADLYL